MRLGQTLLTLGTAAIMAVVALPVSAQGRLSLAERVSRLEQAQAEGQSAQQNIELLNRITALQTEIQSLRGLVEQQSHELDTLRDQARDQYVDLDSRLARLEGGTAPMDGGAAGGVAPGVVEGALQVEPPEVDGGFQDVPSPSVTDPNTIVFEDPEIRAPVDGGSSTSAIAAGNEGTATVLADPAEERRMYESAFDALKEGRYAEAARRFQGFLNTYPNGEFAPNALYWLGESYYVTQNYQIALDTFQRLLRDFPSSSKAPDALLKVGYSFYELRRWPEAEATLNDVVQKYPDSTVARLALGRLRALRMESNR